MTGILAACWALQSWRIRRVGFCNISATLSHATDHEIHSLRTGKRRNEKVVRNEKTLRTSFWVSAYFLRAMFSVREGKKFSILTFFSWFQYVSSPMNVFRLAWWAEWNIQSGWVKQSHGSIIGKRNCMKWRKWSWRRIFYRIPKIREYISHEKTTII